MNLVPYHNQFISDLWFLPENPDELAVYETKLSSLNDTDIEFTGIACPSNCEICYEPSTCVVCSVFFFLNGRKQCNNGVYLDQITYSVFGRERLSEANLFLSGDPPNLPASINHSFLTIRILINQDSSQLVSNSERHCEFVNNNGAVVFDSINWDFNNQSVTPYSDFKYSLENKVFYVTMDLDSGMKDIQKGNCEINSNFNAFLNDGACVIAYTSNASLKGFMGIKYCSGVYINIGESSHMIKPESNKTIGHDEYLMKIPGTSSFAYGKCRNNCKCWDGDIDTLQGYNSCFVNPDTGKVCADGFGLLNYGLDYSRQACVSQAFLDSYQLVYEPLCFAGCKVCDSSKNCIECDTPSFNRNYIDLFKGFLYCGACHVSCFTCSGPSRSECLIEKNKFGLENTIFNFDFNLAERLTECPNNCDVCDDGLCQKCVENHIYNSFKKSCLFFEEQKCQFYLRDKRCLYCSLGKYSKRGICVQCSSNCKICFEETCVACHDGFLLQNGACISIISVAFSAQIIDPLRSLVNLFDAQSSIQKIYYTPTKIYFKHFDIFVSFIAMEILQDFDKFHFSEKITQIEFLMNYRVNCDISDIKGNSLAKTCHSLDQVFLLVDVFSSVLKEDLCASNIKNCVDCKTKKICKRCQDGYIWSKVSRACINLKKINILRARKFSGSLKIIPVICFPGFYHNLKLNKCSKKIQNCEKMSSKNKCLDCVDNFIPDQSKTKCIKCSPYCKKCNFENICILCEEGLFLSFDIGNFSMFK